MLKTKIIWGAVSASGSIYTGSGFRVQPTSRAGVTDIVFEAPFAGVPVVTVTQNYPEWNNWNSYGGDTKDNAVLVAVNASQFRVITGGSSGKGTWRNFTFTAIGPAFT